MRFSLDKEKAIELAKKLNINVTFNNPNSGVTITANGTHKDFDLEDFFPEMVQGGDFITKDRDVFQGEIPIKKPSAIVITDCSEQTITISSSKKLISAA